MMEVAEKLGNKTAAARGPYVVPVTSRATKTLTIAAWNTACRPREDTWHRHRQAILEDRTARPIRKAAQGLETAWDTVTQMLEPSAAENRWVEQVAGVEHHRRGRLLGD